MCWKNKRKLVRDMKTRMHSDQLCKSTSGGKHTLSALTFTTEACGAAVEAGRGTLEIKQTSISSLSPEQRWSRQKHMQKNQRFHRNITISHPDTITDRQSSFILHKRDKLHHPGPREQQVST